MTSQPEWWAKGNERLRHGALLAASATSILIFLLLCAAASATAEDIHPPPRDCIDQLSRGCMVR